MLIRTRLSPDDVEAALRGSLRSEKGFYEVLTFLFTWDGRRPPDFSGWVRDRQFRLRHVAAWRNDTLVPVLRGRIVPSPDGCDVYIRPTPKLTHVVSIVGAIAIMTYVGLRDGTILPGVFAAVFFCTLAALGWSYGKNRAREIVVSVLARRRA